MKKAFEVLLVLAPLAAFVALVTGLFQGNADLAAGFTVLALDRVRALIGAALAGALLFAVVYGPLRSLGHRWHRLPNTGATALAAALAFAPFVAVAGYHLNRSRAVKPSELLELWALIPNLLLLAGAGIVLAVIVAIAVNVDKRSQRPAIWPVALTCLLWAGLEGGVRNAWNTSVKAEHPDVLILLIDALRADELGSYGYPLETTPALDALAREGIVFRHTIAQSTFTKTSIASLFTGKNPYRHGIYEGQRQLTTGFAADVLSEDERTLAESLLRRDILTGAWVQNSHLRKVMGFGQGFVRYHDQQGHIDRIHNAFQPFMNGPARRYPFFAYLHYIDLHDPYLPEPPYDTLFYNPLSSDQENDVYDGVNFAEWGAWLSGVREGRISLTDADIRQLRAYYDGQLRYIDDEIGKLFERLRAKSLYDDTLIIVTSDHGDAFMEHGFVSHSWTPYDELIRVPLIVKLPGGRSAGKVIDDQVRLVDVMPTVLDAVGAPIPPNIDGCSLLPLIEGQTLDESCQLAVSEIADDNSKPTLALRTSTIKYIHQSDAPDELYDLQTDPGELTNIVDDRPEDAARLLAIATSLVAQRRQDVGQTNLDASAIRELKALGYIGDDSPGETGSGAEEPQEDP